MRCESPRVAASVPGKRRIPTPTVPPNTIARPKPSPKIRASGAGLSIHPLKNSMLAGMLAFAPTGRLRGVPCPTISCSRSIRARARAAPSDFPPRARCSPIEQQAFEQIYPASGWVEHDAEVIWATVLSTAAGCSQRLRTTGGRPAAVGITNQRETTVLWDRKSGAPIYNAIVWQDRRTADRCARSATQAPSARRGGALAQNRLVVRSLFQRHENRLDPRPCARRARCGEGRAHRVRHHRQLPAVAPDRRTAARDRCHQREPHRALRPPQGLLGRGAVRVVRCAGRLLARGAGLRRGFRRNRRSVLGEIAADPRRRRRSAGGAHRPSVLRAGEVKSTYGTGAFLVLNTADRLVVSEEPAARHDRLPVERREPPTRSKAPSSPQARRFNGCATDWASSRARRTSRRSPARCRTAAGSTSCPPSRDWARLTGIRRRAARSSDSRAPRAAPKSRAPRSTRSSIRPSTCSRPWRRTASSPRCSRSTAAWR